MFANNAPSLSDIAAVTGNNNDGFGGNNGWWVLIILFALFGGWGRGNNGYDGSTGASGYATAADVQRGFDNQGVTNKLNGLENGLCSFGYDQLGQMNALQANLASNTNALQTQIAEMCCNNREAISGLKYDLSASNCMLTNAINQATQNIMNNDNSNYRALHDEMVAFQMSQKDETIASLRQQVNNLAWQASQEAQTCRLERSINPYPTPAYVVPNPNYNYNNGYYNGCNNGCNNGCGC